MKQHFGMSGHFQLTKRRVLSWNDDGTPNTLSEPTLQTPWFDNLITDAGLNQLGDTSSGYVSSLAYCRIGTGNTAPSNSNVNLVAQVGATNSAGLGAGVGVSVDGTYIYNRVSRRFSAGTINGVNLAEVAMARAYTGNVFSRALITDALNNPITIALDSDEILDVVYELRAYLPVQDQTFDVTIDGVATTVTQRYSTKTEQLTAFAGWLGQPFMMQSDMQNWSLNGEAYETQTLVAAGAGMESSYSGTNKAASIAYSTYVSGSYTRTATLTYNITNANFTTGIGSLYVGSEYNGDGREQCAWPAVGYSFSTKLNKTSTRKAVVAVSITWGRYVP